MWDCERDREKMEAKFKLETLLHERNSKERKPVEEGEQNEENEYDSRLPHN